MYYTIYVYRRQYIMSEKEASTEPNKPTFCFNQRNVSRRRNTSLTFRLTLHSHSSLEASMNHLHRGEAALR